MIWSGFALGRPPRSLLERGLSSLLTGLLLFVAVLPALLVNVTPAQAANVITNGTFGSNIGSWTEVETTNPSDGATEWSSSVGNPAGSLYQHTNTGSSKSWSGYDYQTLTVNSGDTVKLSLWWQKKSVAAQAAKADIKVDIKRPDNSVVTIWSNTQLPGQDATINGSVSNSDQSAAFNQTGTYEIRLKSDFQTGSNSSAQVQGWWDNVVLDVTNTTTVGNGSDPANRNVNQGSANNTLDSFTLQTSTGTDNVTALTVGGSSGVTSTNVNAARLYNDNNNNGALDGGDTLAGSTTISGNNATFSSLSLGVTTTPKYYLIVYDVAAGASSGATLRGKVTSITANNSKTYNDNDGTILTVTSGTNLLTNGTFGSNITGWTKVETLNSSNGDAAWASSIGNPAGSLYQYTNTGKDMSWSAYDYQTVNITAGETYKLGLWWQKKSISTQAAKADMKVDIKKPDGTVVTIWSNTQIPGSGSTLSGTVTDLDVSAYFDQTGTYEIRFKSDFRTGDSDTAQVQGWWDNLSLNQAMGTPTVTIGNGSNPANQTVAAGAIGLSVDSFTMKMNTGTDSVTSLAVTGSANTNSTNVSSAKLYNDNNGNGALDGGDTLIGSTTFSGNTATFNSLAVGVTATQKYYLIVYDVAPGAANGATLTGTVSTVNNTNPVTYSDSGSAALTVDTQAPGTVTGFAAQDDQNAQSSLSWTNPAAADLAEVRVMRKTGSYPTEPTDGTQVFSDTTAPFDQTYTDTGLTNETTYYYAAFTKDAVGNWNSAITTGVNADTARPDLMSITVNSTYNRDGTSGSNSNDFGSVPPSQSPYTIHTDTGKHAIEFAVMSNVPWDLKVVAEGDLNGGGGKTIPISRLSVRKHGTNDPWTPLSTSQQTLESNNAPTGGAAYRYDFRLDTNYQDAPATYNTNITFVIDPH